MHQIVQVHSCVLTADPSPGWAQRIVDAKRAPTIRPDHTLASCMLCTHCSQTPMCRYICLWRMIQCSARQCCIGPVTITLSLSAYARSFPCKTLRSTWGSVYSRSSHHKQWHMAMFLMVLLLLLLLQVKMLHGSSPTLSPSPPGVCQTCGQRERCSWLFASLTG